MINGDFNLFDFFNFRLPKVCAPNPRPLTLNTVLHIILRLTIYFNRRFAADSSILQVVSWDLTFVKSLEFEKQRIS